MRIYIFQFNEHCLLLEFRFKESDSTKEEEGEV